MYLESSSSTTHTIADVLVCCPETSVSAELVTHKKDQFCGADVITDGFKPVQTYEIPLSFRLNSVRAFGPFDWQTVADSASEATCCVWKTRRCTRFKNSVTLDRSHFHFTLTTIHQFHFTLNLSCI